MSPLRPWEGFLKTRESLWPAQLNVDAQICSYANIKQPRKHRPSHMAPGLAFSHESRRYARLFYSWVASSMTEKPPIDERHAELIEVMERQTPLGHKCSRRARCNKRLGSVPVERLFSLVRALLWWFAPKVQACDDVFAAFIFISVQNLGPTVSLIPFESNRLHGDLPLVSKNATCGCSSP